ncbi:hypothetical protein YC2023_014494 [Brassica napus]
MRIWNINFLFTRGIRAVRRGPPRLLSSRESIHPLSVYGQGQSPSGPRKPLHASVTFWEGWRSTVERERLACSVVVFFREMEANLDPSSPAEAYSDQPSPTLASGKGSLLQLRLRRLLVTESGGLQSSALPLRNPVSFGLKLLVRFVSSSVRLPLRWAFGSLRMRYR